MNSEQKTMSNALGAGRRALPREVPVGYKQTDLGLLPNTWEAVLLGDLFVLKNGLNKAKRFFGTGTPIVNYMDVFECPGLRTDDLSGRVNLSPEEIKNYEVRLGDVFFTRTSETVEDVGVASVMLNEPCDTVFSGFVLRARPRDGRLDDRYKQYCFGPRAIRSQIVSNATYTTRALTNGRSLSAVWIAVPPKPEQRAIAEALSDVDGLLGALETLIAKKRAIKQAAMQQLLTGKTRLPGFSGEWEMKRVGDLLYYERPDRYIVQCTDYSEYGDVPVLTANKSFVLGYIDEGFGICTDIPVIVFDDFTTDCKYATSPFKVKSSAIKLLRARQNRAHLRYVFERMQLIRFPLGDHKRYYISDYQNIELPVPDFDEQLALASVLSDMDAETAALERRRDKTRAVKQGMMQQLLTGRVRLVEPDLDLTKR